MLPVGMPVHPEITLETVREARDDVIFGTGRSDYPNQVNNVLGFPFIFRGALDVRARAINEEMKLAAVHALAEPIVSSMEAQGMAELYRTIENPLVPS